MQISVIIPCYNDESYIAECLESVCSQTIQDMEIICVDDGSTDRTGELLAQWQQKDSRIHVIRQENAGVSGARNTGLSHARGDYVYFLDGDDRIAAPDTLDFCCDLMDRHNLDVLVGGGNLFFEPPELQERYSGGGFKEKYYTIEHTYNGVYSGPDSVKNLRANNDWCVTVATKVFRREFLLENNLFFILGQIHEDEYYALCSMFLAKRVMIVNDSFYDRRIRENSIMTKPVSHESAMGNLINFIEGLRFLERSRGIHELDLEIGKTVLLARQHFLRKYRMLDETEKAQLTDLLTPDQRFYYEAFFRSELDKAEQIEGLKTRLAQANNQNKQLIKELSDLERQAKNTSEELKQVKKQAARSEKQLQAIKQSRSYRLGLALTAPLRIIKNVTQKIAMYIQAKNKGK